MIQLFPKAWRKGDGSHPRKMRYLTPRGTGRKAPDRRKIAQPGKKLKKMASFLWQPSWKRKKGDRVKTGRFVETSLEAQPEKHGCDG